MTAKFVPEWYTDETLYRNGSVEEYVGSRGSREEFVNAQGLKLASYFFPAAGQAKALAILVHGHGCSLVHEFLSHSEPGQAHTYRGSLVEKLNAVGIAAAGVDLQGCGHSEGIRCYVDCFQDYVQEVSDFSRAVDTEKRPGFAGLPKFVIGESLGGCIAVHLCKSSEEFSGAVLLAPMLSLERVSKAGLNPYLRPLAGLASWLLPRAQIAKTERNYLYPHIQAYFDKDPQTWKGWTRARNAYEYLNVTEALCQEMSELTFPFLVIHGDADTMTDPDGSKKLVQQSQAQDKELVLIPQRWHVLLKEEGYEGIISRVVGWIQARIEPSAP